MATLGDESDSCCRISLPEIMFTASINVVITIDYGNGEALIL
jgi:hypothetical protein